MRVGRLTSVAIFWLLCAPDLLAFQRPPERCDQYYAAVKADSNDVEAASRLGRCSVRDYEMIAPDGDSTRLVFRSSWSVALRALRRAVTLDPTYSPAYRPLFRILFDETRDGCSFVTGICGHVAPVLRDGDSVITVPRQVLLNIPGRDTYQEVILEGRATRHANIAEARDHARRWAAAAPNDRRPHEYLGRALLGLGDPGAAAVELEYAASLGTTESRRELFWDRLEALVKSDRGADARRVLDEAVSDRGRDTTRLRAFSVAHLNALVGRHRPVPVDSTRARLFRARIDSMRRDAPPMRPAPSFSDHLAAGDTVAARRVLARLDSSITALANERRLPYVSRDNLESARYHLILGDTARAEARLAEIETARAEANFQFIGAFEAGSPWLGHAWLLAGDLFAARGRQREAARMYRRVVGLWGGGDADLQPVVERAREKLRALGL